MTTLRFKGKAAQAVLDALSGVRSEDRSTHAKYVAATGENIGYAEYLELRAYWAELGGSFYGPNVEHGTMPESKLLPLLRRLKGETP